MTPLHWRQPDCVGRVAERQLIRELAAQPGEGGVVVRGSAGVGKSRLAEQLVADWANDARPTAQIVALPALQSMPFGALAGLLAGNDVALDRPLAVLAAVQRSLGGARSLVVVDDVQWLDEASISVLTQLVALDAAFVVATLRADAGNPAPSAAVRGFVHAASLRVVELDALGPTELADLVVSSLGVAMNSESVAELWQRSRGNPLHAGELLRGALHEQRIAVLPTGLAHLSLSTSGSSVLSDAIAERLLLLPSPARDALELLTVAEELTVDDVQRSDLLDRFVELEQLGWVDVEHGGELVRLGHPLYREAVRGGMSDAAVARRSAEVAAMIGSRPHPLRDDPLRVAMLQIAAGIAPSAEVLLAGAQRARAAVDMSSTLQLALAAHEVGGTLEARHLAVEALFLSGRFDDAEDLAGLALPVDSNPFTTVSFMMLRMDNTLWGRGSPDAARAVVEEYRPVFAPYGLEMVLDAPYAFINSQDARTAQAVSDLGPMPSDDMALLLSSLARASAHLGQGQFEDVLAVCHRSMAILAAMPDPNAMMSPAIFTFSLGFAFNGLGRFHDTIDQCVAAYRVVVDQQITLVRCFMGLAIGHAALRQGDITTARRWFDEIVAATETVRMVHARRLAVAGLAACAGHVDDAVAAAATRNELAELQDGNQFLRFELVVGAAWAEVACGRQSVAVDLLRAGVERDVADRELAGVLWQLVELVRLGDGAWAASVADSVPDLATIHGPLAALHCRLVASMAARDSLAQVAPDDARRSLADELDEIAAGYAKLGAHVLAAEVAVLACMPSNGSSGDRRRVTRRGVAAGLRQRVSDVVTPILRDAPTVDLSARELEIARLAASGSTSREIGAALYLSPRTVENHLHRVYDKLGLSGREELIASPAIA
jgi:DNA-binding CsgD family transcriptional regulator